jgi:signal transduction histidine kinase
MDRARSETVKVGIGLGLVFAFGFGLLGLHLVHAFGEGESIWTFLYGILIPLALAVGLLAGGAWLWTEGTDGDAVLRVAAWSLLGGNALALTAGLTILYQASEGVVMSDRLFAVAGQASVGAVVGFVVGVYDVRQREAKRRAQSLSNQLTVLNRVLRHDIRNGATVIQGRIDHVADEQPPRNGDEPVPGGDDINQWIEYRPADWQGQDGDVPAELPVRPPHVHGVLPEDALAVEARGSTIVFRPSRHRFDPLAG